VQTNIISILDVAIPLELHSSRSRLTAVATVQRSGRSRPRLGPIFRTMSLRWRVKYDCHNESAGIRSLTAETPASCIAMCGRLKTRAQISVYRPQLLLRTFLQLVMPCISLIEALLGVSALLRSTPLSTFGGIHEHSRFCLFCSLDMNMITIKNTLRCNSIASCILVCPRMSMELARYLKQSGMSRPIREH
jgi:hypothetical protein